MELALPLASVASSVSTMEYRRSDKLSSPLILRRSILKEVISAFRQDTAKLHCLPVIVRFPGSLGVTYNSIETVPDFGGKTSNVGDGSNDKPSPTKI